VSQAKERLAEDGLLVGEVGRSAEALIDAFPNVPFLWPDLVRGGDGVFIVEAAGLS
jgi:ribosomal protein L3 glutamine methyltransferase